MGDQGVNRACQFKQRTHATKKPKVCINCRVNNSSIWYHSLEGRPYIDMHCLNWFFYRRRTGVHRPPELQAILDVRRTRPPKPAGLLCQHCSHKARQGKDLLWSSASIWLCGVCAFVGQGRHTPIASYCAHSTSTIDNIFRRLQPVSHQNGIYVQHHPRQVHVQEMRDRLLYRQQSPSPIWTALKMPDDPGLIHLRDRLLALWHQYREEVLPRRTGA